MVRSFQARVASWLVGASVFLAVGAGGSFAHADEKGDKALSSLDQTIFKAKTQQFEYDVSIQVPEKAERKLKLAVFMKGEFRFSEFLAPSDVKGTKVLVLSPTQMYVYLPAFKKVRRIASHVTDQGFMGMNFAQDELAITSYPKMYSATVASDDGKTMKLALAAKPGADAPYEKLEITLDKAKNLPSEIKYFSGTGTLLKTETRGDYACEKETCFPKTLKMVDHTKNGAATVLKVIKSKINEDIPDSRFSKRALEEG